MRKPPRTELRGNQWYYRRRVPTKLGPILGFSEYRESLNTSEMAVARTRAAIRDAEVTVELQAAQLVLQKAPVSQAAKLTPAALRYIRDAVHAHTMKVDEEYRQSRPDSENLWEYQSILGDHYEETGQALAFGTPVSTPEERARIDEALQAVGIRVPDTSEEWQSAAMKAREGYNLSLQAIYSRSAGRHVPTPEAPEMPSQLSTGPTLRLGSVMDCYMATVKQSGYTRKVKRCLQLFGEVIGRDTPVKDIRQKAVTGFLRDICKLPSNWATSFDRGIPVAVLMAGEHEEVISPTTYRDNYRAPLGAFLEESRRDRGDDGFPGLVVKGIEYVGNRKANEDQQRALYDEELKLLIEGPEFAAIAADPKQESMYWFTVLSLFTGARPRELCQVNPQADFGQLDGAWYIDLSPDTPAGKGITKTIKSGEERRIPLHAQLVALGLPEHLERLKGEGADRLFPAFRVKSGDPYEAAGEDFAQLLRDCGLRDDTAAPGRRVLSAYVLRKTFITKARNQGVVSKEITGHSDGSTTLIQDRHYIFGQLPLDRKVKELAKFSLPVKVPSPVWREG